MFSPSVGLGGRVGGAAVAGGRVGPAGAGKTHLAHVWAAEAGATIIPATSLAEADIPALAARACVAVEDASAVAGVAGLERALFHLHNLVLQEGGRLLLTDRAAPVRWPLALLEPPDDALLAAVLVKLFADRQVAVPPALIPYLTQRMERSFDAARGLVERLDARALAEARPVSRPLAAAVLGEMPDETLDETPDETLDMGHSRDT